MNRANIQAEKTYTDEKTFRRVERIVDDCVVYVKWRTKPTGLKMLHWQYIVTFANWAVREVK